MEYQYCELCLGNKYRKNNQTTAIFREWLPFRIVPGRIIMLSGNICIDDRSSNNHQITIMEPMTEAWLTRHLRNLIGKQLTTCPSNDFEPTWKGKVFRKNYVQDGKRKEYNVRWILAASEPCNSPWSEAHCCQLFVDFRPEKTRRQ